MEEGKQKMLKKGTKIHLCVATLPIRIKKRKNYSKISKILNMRRCQFSSNFREHRNFYQIKYGTYLIARIGIELFVFAGIRRW